MEGLHNKVKLVTRRSFEFRTPEGAKPARLHNLGDLPETNRTHKSCCGDIMVSAADFDYDVFLSHGTADKPAVEELARRLKREGIEPWLDKWNLIPGQESQLAMERALADCATCAVFIGPGGLGPWQNEEMRAAIARRVGEKEGQFRVIPVLLPGMERPERGKLPAFLTATTLGRVPQLAR